MSVESFPWVDVRDHGAVGDGVTDDTDALQAALDAVPATGGAVVFEPKTYLITGGLTSLTPNIELRGSGGLGQHAAVGVGATVILCSGAITGFTFNPAAETTLFRGPVLRDLVFKGSSSGVGGVLLRRTNNWLLENVSCTGFTAGYGIFSDGVGSGAVNQYGTIENPNVSNCQVGIDAVFSNGIRVFGGMIDANSNGGSPASGSTGIRVQSGDTFRLYGTAIQYAATCVDLQGTGSAYHELYGVRCEGFTTGVKIACDRVRSFGGSFSSGSGTAFVVESSADSTAIIHPQFGSIATKISDSGTNTTWQLTSYLNLPPGGRIEWGGDTGVFVKTGAGSPEGSLTAPVGSLYLRNNGGSATCLYVKESGSGNTGWIPK